MPRRTDHAQYLATRTFESLDGVRALAVLWVVMFHCEPSRLGLQWLRWHGDLGVDVFFVLSGFLITTLLLRERPAPVLVQLGRFHARRALRILPLYYAGVLLYWVAVRVGGQPQAVAEYDAFLPSLLGYWSDWRLAFAEPMRPPFLHAWSLAVEEKFYLLWPLPVLLWPRATVRMAACGIALVVGWRAWLVAGGATEVRLYHAFELRLDALLWGALLAGLAHDRRGFAFVQQAGRATVFWAAVAAFVVCVVTTTNAQASRYVIVPASVAVVLAGLVLRRDRPGTALLRTRWLRHVGKVSYCVYIVHPLCLQVVQRVCGGSREAPIDGLFEFALGAPLAVAVATVSFRWFERPFLRLQARFRSAADGPPAAPAAATAPPSPPPAVVPLVTSSRESN